MDDPRDEVTEDVIGLRKQGERATSGEPAPPALATAAGPLRNTAVASPAATPSARPPSAKVVSRATSFPPVGTVCRILRGRPCRHHDGHQPRGDGELDTSDLQGNQTDQSDVQQVLESCQDRNSAPAQTGKPQPTD